MFQDRNKRVWERIEAQMARIRSIKPQFWGDDKTARVSRDARLLALGLISMSDDGGRFLASHSSICGYAYPHDEIKPAQLAKWLKELESVGFVHLYEVNGLRYGCFLTYSKHQRISHPQPSPLPAPQDVIEA